MKTKKEVLSDLGPDRIGLLHRIVRDGVKEFSRRHKTLRVDQSKRSERSNLHDYMVKSAKLLTAGASDLTTSLTNNLFLVHVGEYSIKLKKLDSRFCVASFPTQAVIDFQDQNPQASFAGFPGEPMNLHLGYQDSDDLVDLADAPVFLVCPLGGTIVWAISLDDEVQRSNEAGPARSDADQAEPARATVRIAADADTGDEEEKVSS